MMVTTTVSFMMCSCFRTSTNSCCQNKLLKIHFYSSSIQPKLSTLANKVFLPMVHSYLIALHSSHRPKLQPLYKLVVLFLLPFLSWLNFHVKTQWKWHPAALGWDTHIRLLTPRLGEHYGREEQKDS